MADTQARRVLRRPVMGQPGEAVDDTLGRLDVFGVSEPYQVAFLLPHRWEDFRFPAQRLAELDEADFDTKVLLRGGISGDFTREGRTHKYKGRLRDSDGETVSFTVFGGYNAARLIERCPTDFGVLGSLKAYRGRLSLGGAEVIERRWLGRTRPIYPGSKAIGPERVRERVLKILPGVIPTAASFIAEALAEVGDRERLAALAGVEGWPLETIIKRAHLPLKPEHGYQAQRAMERLSALHMLVEARRNNPRPAIEPTPLAPLAPLAEALPFALTEEQRDAVQAIRDDMGAGRPMRRLLSGDVGTGKTVVFALAAASVARAGGLAYILLPNEILVEQTAAAIDGWWPELTVERVKGGRKKVELDVGAGAIVVGTTALLNRDLPRPALIVADEQQKFSIDQRERLSEGGVHRLEATATCVPRTQAFVQYGGMQVSRLKKPHVEKYIDTRIRKASEREQLFKDIQTTIDAGQQVMVLYPLKSDSDRGGNKRAAIEAFDLWQKRFGERVVLIHGGGTKRDKQAQQTAVDDMRAGRADIVVATTVAEVGLDLPNLNRVTIISPERLGASTLHQIRGRAARTGGTGYCDLFLPETVKDEAMDRLNVLVNHQSGFRVAEEDLKLRGFGDLSGVSGRQHGKSKSLLFGRSISVDTVAALTETLDAHGVELDAIALPDAPGGVHGPSPAPDTPASPADEAVEFFPDISLG